MPRDKVLLFRPYPFEVGQKIRIEGGPRAGDWVVIAIDDHKIKLRCPVKGCEVEWRQFCYSVSESEDIGH